jgi:hypothetical protein
MDSAVLGLASPVIVDVKGTVLGFEHENAHSRMLLDPTPARLKLLHACDQWHSSRESIFLPVDTVNCVATLKVVGCGVNVKSGDPLQLTMNSVTHRCTD